MVSAISTQLPAPVACMVYDAAFKHVCKPVSNGPVTKEVSVVYPIFTVKFVNTDGVVAIEEVLK